jgi:hypothetical protein
VNPTGEEKGLLMLYNPLNEKIIRKITVPVYYTGLHNKLVLEDQQGKTQTVAVSRDYEIAIEVEIPANGYSYFLMR